MLKGLGPQSGDIQILFSSVVLYVLQTCALKGNLF